MRRLGVILLVLGIAGFLYASSRKAKYESAMPDPSFSSPAAEAVYRWETARWLLAGMGVIGLVFTVLPGKNA